MNPPYQVRNRITYDRFGRAWTVSYSSADGSEYGYLLPVPPGRTARRHGGHRRVHERQQVAASTAGRMARAPVPPRINPYTGEVVDADDGMADNMRLQAMFHSRQGQAQWSASYRVVRDVTVVYSLLVGSSLLILVSPELLATGRLAMGTFRMGLLGPSLLRYFWSGGLAFAGAKAAELAEDAGGMTLEMTPFGTWISEVAPRSMPLWRFASSLFAEGADGPVICVQADSLGLAPVWAREYALLLGKNMITYVSASGKW